MLPPFYHNQLFILYPEHRSDRTPATLGNITAGDIVNVYGYYNSGDGSIDAEIVRDLSKPNGSVTPITVTASSTVLAQIQADVDHFSILVAQLQAEISSAATAPGSSSVSAPMIPAPGY